MPSAKPAYDIDGSWKYPQYSTAAWSALEIRVRSGLRPLYPDENAVSEPAFGHPADEWANYLLDTAHRAISGTLWKLSRLTNAELHAEKLDLLTTLRRSAKSLGAISHDFEILLGINADTQGTRDQLLVLIEQIETGTSKIANLPIAIKVKDARNAAALEMAIQCLRIFKRHGGKISSTADMDLGYVSNAIKVLKVLGDELGLPLSQPTWKRVISKAKKQAKDLQALTAPDNLGA